MVPYGSREVCSGDKVHVPVVLTLAPPDEYHVIFVVDVGVTPKYRVHDGPPNVFPASQPYG